MARITLKDPMAYQQKLASVSKKLDGMLKYACYDAAGMVVESIKKHCPVDEGSESEGDLRDSYITTPYQYDRGEVYTKITCAGYDSRGVPNLIKARVLESGRSKPDGGITGKHRFVEKAVRAVRSQAQASIEKNLTQALEKAMK